MFRKKLKLGELIIYINNKLIESWVIYIIDKEIGKVIDLVVNQSYKLDRGKQMIIEKSFNDLKNELLKTIIDLNKDVNTDEKYSGTDEYEKFLNELYFDFVQEVRDNLITIKEEKARNTYLESLLNMLVHLNGQKFFRFLLQKENALVNKNQIQPEFIFNNEQVFALILKMSQKSIVKDLMDFLEKLLKGEPEHYLSVSKSKCWQEEVQEDYPEITRIKGELSTINTISGQLLYLQKERKRMAEIYRREGIDLYRSPINFFFESRIDCLKEIGIQFKPLHTVDTAQKGEDSDQVFSDTGLRWLAKKSDLVEVIYGLYHSGAIDKNKISIQELASALGQLFSIDLNDVYRTYSEIRSRKLVQIKFLDHMKSCLQSKMKELDEKM